MGPNSTIMANDKCGGHFLCKMNASSKAALSHHRLENFPLEVLRVQPARGGLTIFRKLSVAAGRENPHVQC